MKILLDENIGQRVAEALRALNNTECEICHILDDMAAGTPDTEWLLKFGQKGGTAIISGDVRIMQRPHELAAFFESGLVCYFLERRWNQQNGFNKAALIIKVWPHILTHVVDAAKPSAWQIPYHFNSVNFKPISPPK